MNRLQFSTDREASDEAFAAYHDLYAPVADVVRLGEAFSVKVEAHRLGDLILFDRHLVGVRHERSPKRVARNGFDHFTVQLAIKGTFQVRTDAGRHEVSAGGLALIDMDRPMATDALDANILTLSVPRPLVESASPQMDRLHGTVLSADQCALLRDFLISFLRHEESLFIREPARVGRIVTELLAVALENTKPEGQDGVQDALDVACRQQARRYIDGHLTAQPDEIARAIGRSRSALYRAFEPHGGVARYIQTRRLSRLRALLADMRDGRSISQLAYACGFASDSHCSRSFKAAFGVTPGDYRVLRRSAGESGAAASETSRVLERWWSDLR